MQNFTTPQEAKIVEVTGLVTNESALGTSLQTGDVIASETVLVFSRGSELALVFADGSSLKVIGSTDGVLTTEIQLSEPEVILQSPENQTPNLATNSVQNDINAIQELIASDNNDIELPDTAAGGLNGNEGTDFVTLERDGNELLASAGYDTGELDNAVSVQNIVPDPVNIPDNLPDAVDDVFNINENTPLAGNVIGNDD
ncbi:retention module-containing protein, partial [Paraglaciecola sp.]|uniref:retention module-containing protein n=1 Tax=Paraglaciecola sp. TaxID=1920173 RepID=UPI003EFA0333